jgi:hypothetical protein
MIDAETLWNRIEAHEGQVLHQIRRQAFTYEVRSSTVWPSTLAVGIGRSQFEQALPLLPLANTVPVHGLRGPS